MVILYFKQKMKSVYYHNNLSSLGGNWWLMLTAVVIISFSTRFYNVTVPDHVCWDETHFGKMGSWYINRTFFFDVHPPLGKMLIALSGYITGYDGNFLFDKPGDKYENVNYIGMRVFCTFLGSCIAPLAFLIVWELTNSVPSSLLSSIFIICDVGILTLSQYILLDPILLFFIMFSTFGMFKFYNNKNCAFSRRWWAWLCFTGTMLACAVSVKFVGLFVVIFCGIHTLWQLWELMSDMNVTMKCMAKHFLARVIGLILLPVLLYVIIFYIHLTILNKSGNGDGFFSSAFQSQLANNSLHNASMPREVAYGAVVTFKNGRTGGGYLHSHWHLYPEGVGARQQQITTYTHKDDNNKWLIKSYQTSDEENAALKNEIVLLKHGNLVRLEHVPTRRNLHSHREIAPITKKHYQVTGYGENGTGDPNDIWKVHIVGGSHGDVVKTVTSQIKLIHYLQHCVLTTTGKQLPTWAFEQQEVTCNPNIRDSYGYWNIEENYYPKLPNVSFDVYASSFVERLIESHAVMLQGNAGLKPKDGEVTSRPWQWPINYRGQFFSGNSYRIYLLGNPIIWWVNLVILAVFILLLTVYSLAIQRGKKIHTQISGEDNFIGAVVWLFIGWSLHYLPFWVMGRVLYFHHYFPALLFNSMLSGIILNYLVEVVSQIILRNLAKTLYQWSFGVMLSTVAFSFYKFSPLAYGMSGPYANEPNSTMYGLKWMDSWEF